MLHWLILYTAVALAGFNQWVTWQNTDTVSSNQACKVGPTDGCPIPQVVVIQENDVIPFETYRPIKMYLLRYLSTLDVSGYQYIRFHPFFPSVFSIKNWGESGTSFAVFCLSLWLMVARKMLYGLGRRWTASVTPANRSETNRRLASESESRPND